MVIRFEDAAGVLGRPAGPVWSAADAPTALTDWASATTDPLRLWKTQPSLRKVVGFVAEQISGLPWHAFERVADGDRRRRSDSPAEGLLRAPGRLTTGAAQIAGLVTDWMLYDRYLALVLDGQIMRVPPRRWAVKSDHWGRPGQILLRTPEGEPDVDVTDAPLIVDWGWGDLKAGGVSPLTTLAETLDEARESVLWRRRQWDNAPRFGGLLRHPATFRDAKARETFTVSWRAWQDERRGTPILEDGMEYVLPAQMSPKEARDIEGRQWTDIEVCGQYLIPPELLGIRPGNYSNMQAFRAMLFGQTLGPKISRLEQAVNRVVPALDATPGLYLECSREAALNGSILEQAQVLQTMTGGPIMTRSEARQRLNLPHLDDADDLIVPLNVLVGGQASPTDSGSQNVAGADGPAGAFGGTAVAYPSGTRPGPAARTVGDAPAVVADTEETEG